MATEDVLFRAVFTEFSNTYQKALRTTEKLQLVFGLLGVFGCSLGLAAMLQSAKMVTSSFTYHKTLTAASLVSCLNFLLLKLCTDMFSVKQFTYYNRTLAVYSGIISRSISSTCGYVGLYMTLFVALDRTFALMIPTQYTKLNQIKLSRCLIVAAIVLSATLHSWATWFETEIFSVPDTATTVKNETVFSYKPSTSVPKDLIRIKNLYNSILRLPYPFLLAILTGVSIWLFAKKGSDSTQSNGVTSNRRLSLKKALQSDRSLFLLMICVVVLAFVHVTPREVKRLLGNYPVNYVTLPME